MLVKDVMTKNVITVTSKTPVGDAQKIMKEHDFRRLPVVDHGKLVGMATLPRLEQVKPPTGTPLLWQITYLISHTTVGDIMRKNVVTVKPEDTVEQAIAKAQANKVGTLLVIDPHGKLVGICTTNDFFYKIVNPTLGLGEPGSRIIIDGGADGKAAEKIINCINKLGIKMKVVWGGLPLAAPGRSDLILQLDTEDAHEVIKQLVKLGFKASIRPR